MVRDIGAKGSKSERQSDGGERVGDGVRQQREKVE